MDQMCIALQHVKGQSGGTGLHCPHLSYQAWWIKLILQCNQNISIAVSRGNTNKGNKKLYYCAFSIIYLLSNNRTTVHQYSWRRLTSPGTCLCSCQSGGPRPAGGKGTGRCTPGWAPAWCTLLPTSRSTSAHAATIHSAPEHTVSRRKKKYSIKLQKQQKRGMCE